jgi:hypothetical protein
MPDADSCHAASCRLRDTSTPPTLLNSHLSSPMGSAEIEAGACGRLKGVLACNAEQGGPLHMGPAAATNRPPTGPKYETISRRPSRRRDPLDRTAPALWRTQKGAFSSTRFARVRVPRAFRRFFEISYCRFEISIQRPKAHFARRSRAERFASHGPTGGTTVSLQL